MWRRGRADGGEIKQNPILFHPDPVRREEEDSSHMKEQEGTQKPKACVRKPIPAPRIWCHPECKYPSTRHWLASPLLCHISELLYMWCWWVCSMDTHLGTEMVETRQEHSSTGSGQSTLGRVLWEVHWEEYRVSSGKPEEVRLLLANANNRDTLTTRASPPNCSFVLLSGFPLFCTAQRMAIFDLIIHNY